VDITKFIKGRRSKADDVPGTVDEYLDETCPACGKGLKRMKACCGAPEGYIQCRANCGYRRNL
jgi:hypothetical protein